MFRGTGGRLLLDRVGDRVLYTGEKRHRCDGDGAAYAGGGRLLRGDGAHAGRAAGGELHRRRGQGVESGWNCCVRFFFLPGVGGVGWGGGGVGLLQVVVSSAPIGVDVILARDLYACVVRFLVFVELVFNGRGGGVCRQLARRVRADGEACNLSQRRRSHVFFFVVGVGGGGGRVLPRAVAFVLCHRGSS